MPEPQQINTTNPLVSVIIPAYNAEKFIQKTLESVLNQTYHNIEVLVVDDGSQDTTPEIVKSITQQDSRVILLQQKNAGVSAARNLAISKSRGEYIAPIDADDIWFPQNLEKKVQCIVTSDINVGLVYSWSVYIDEEDSLTGGFVASPIEGKVYTTLVYQDFIGNASSCLIRRTCFDKIGVYNLQLKEGNTQGCEDFDLYIRIAEYYQFRVVTEFLVGYRKLTNSMSSDYTTMAKFRYVIWQSIRQKYPYIPTKLYQLSLVSFYMYLARQTSQKGNYRHTLHWLWLALKTDVSTLFLRYGFYVLLIKSCLQIIFKPITSQILNPNNLPIPAKQNFQNKQPGMTLNDFQQKKRWAIQLRLLVWDKLHRLIPRLFGSQKTWANIE